MMNAAIIMMSGTFIASLLGMNVPNGLEHSHIGFIIALIISFAVSLLCWFIMKFKRLI